MRFSITAPHRLFVNLCVQTAPLMLVVLLLTFGRVLPAQAEAMPSHHHHHAGIQPPTGEGHQHAGMQADDTKVNKAELNQGKSYSADIDNLPKPKMGEHEYFGSVIVDRLEMANARNNFSTTYDWQAWFGKDYDKALVRAEGEIEDGQFKNARNELLWCHALTPYWDSHLGIRYDSGLGAERTWGAFGLQGYLPYWIYVEATGYVGEGARTAFRLEFEYDLLFTQKLILQPRIEMNFYSRRDPSRLVSSGLSNIEAGLRLRYELIKEFAPYIGIEWASSFGSAADNIRALGNKADETRFIAGVHFWF